VFLSTLKGIFSVTNMINAGDTLGLVFDGASVTLASSCTNGLYNLGGLGSVQRLHTALFFAT